jgi:VanZ family protein
MSPNGEVTQSNGVRLRRLVLCLALGLYVVGLVIATHLPGSTVEALTEDSPPGLDKLFHLSGYLGLGLLAAAVWHDRRPASWPSAIRGLCCLAGFAALDELLQGWPGLGREPDVFDFLSDLVGGGLGWGLWLTGRWLLGRSAGRR